MGRRAGVPIALGGGELTHEVAIGDVAVRQLSRRLVALRVEDLLGGDAVRLKLARLLVVDRHQRA